jgi:hypothetical protein
MNNFNNSYSLEGEDIILESLLRNVKIANYFDIGCSDPIIINNTYKFYLKGWTGLACDGRTELENIWSNKRPKDIFKSCLIGEKSINTDYYKFPDPTLNTIDINAATRYSERFEKNEIIIENRRVYSGRDLWNEFFSVPPTLVSIDCEGYDLYVLKGLISDAFRPACVVVETKLFNFINPFSSEIFNFMYHNRYIMIAKTPLDAFFIDPKNIIFNWIPSSMLTS